MDFITVDLVNFIKWGTSIKHLQFLGLNTLEWAGLAIATFIIFYFGWALIQVIYDTWLGQMLGHYADLKKMGRWAVITGATDGIGKAYAQELAKLGINVVLISRTLEKLKNVADEIEKEYKVETKIIAVDFTQGVEIYDMIRKELDGLEIGTLINNVGMAYPYPEYFLDMPNGDKLCQDMIFCNVMSFVMMMRIVMPQMAERKRGVVVNMASLSAVSPTPLMSMYGASKSFMDKLTRDLVTEYKDTGIIIQSVLPGYVATKMSRIRSYSYTAPSPVEYTKVALKTIGLQTRSAVYPPHRVMLFGISWGNFFFPEYLSNVAYKTIHQMWLKAKRNQARRAKAQ